MLTRKGIDKLGVVVFGLLLLGCDRGAEPRCGDGIAQGSEICDSADLASARCETLGAGWTGGALACQPDCQGYDVSACTGAPASCGNGQQEGSEVCDGTDLAGHSCATVPGDFDGGVLACRADCGGWNTSGCVPHVVVCGDDTREENEVCDGADLDGQTCSTLGQGFNGGELACAAGCTTWDTSLCWSTLPVCGNNALEPGERCDGLDLGGNDCTTIGQGYTGGELACASSCTAWDSSQCWTTPPVCGNGILEAGELCDGTDFGGQDCASSPWYTGGNLFCYPGCTSFSDMGCWSYTFVCGNGVLEEGELCEPTDLNGYDCTTVPGGFTGGTLVCGAGCRAFDTSGCLDGNVLCGNGVIDPGEVCDGEALGGLTCQDLGYTQGRLYCDGSCTSVLAGGCHNGSGTCGNGIAEPQEDCDGNDLRGWTCVDFGFQYTPGALACTTDCIWDFSACVGDLCAQQGWYYNGECNPCERWGGVPDPDCEIECLMPDGHCSTSQHSDLPVSSCLHAVGVEDPDCGTCGDGTWDYWVEWCDAPDIQVNCTHFGYSSGTLGCLANCQPDTTGCVP